MQTVERLLVDLQAALNDVGTDEDPVGLVDQLEATCIEALRHESDSDDVRENELNAELLFASETPPSLLMLLLENLRTKDQNIITAKIHACKFIRLYIKESDQRVDVYIPNIVHKSWELFRRETDSNRLKAAALSPLNAALRKRSTTLTAEVVEAPKKAEVLLETLRFGKTPKTVKSEALKVLGLLVHFYPDDESMQNQVPSILNICHQVLSSNFGPKSTPELPLIAGALSCLDRCISHFEQRYADNSSRESLQLFNCVNTILASVTNESLHRYAVVGKALRLLKNHASLFSELIGADARAIYERMIPCLFSDNDTIKKHADGATDEVFTVLGDYLLHHGVERIDLLKMFVKNWIEILSDPRPHNPRLILAVKGLSCMGAAVQSVFQNLTELYTDSSTSTLASLIERCQWALTSLSGTEAIRTSTNLHSSNLVVRRKSEFLLALSSFVQFATDEDLNESVLEFLTSSCTDIFLGYPLSFPRQKSSIARVLCLLLLGLEPREAVALFLDRIIPVCLARTISRLEPGEKPPAAIINPSTGETDFRLFAAYIPLWKELFDPEDARTKRYIFQSSLSDRQSVSAQRLFNRLMQECLTLTRTLCLTYERRVAQVDEEVTEEIVPKVPVDHELFINLVSFLELLMPQLKPTMVTPWISVLFERFESLSFEYPLVSATYKMNRTLFIIIGENSCNFDWNQFCNATKHYCRHVIAQCAQFRDELLASAVSMVLRTPAGILPFTELLPLLTLALRTGLTYLPLAVVAMEKLENADRMELFTHAKAILKLLEPYISLRSSESQSKTRPRKDGKVIETESDQMKSFQNRILNFLGRLGGKNQDILTPPDEALATMLHWKLQLKVELPFSMDYGSIYLSLDSIVPRVLQLCEHMSDRQLKALAMESLHSITIYTVGRGATDPARTRRSQFSETYRKTLPAVLRLAAGVDPVSRQLYQKLLRQIIHWFSGGSSQVNAQDTFALIDTLLDGICDASNGSIREICAHGISEYLKYAIKQTTKKESAKDPLSAEALMLRVFGLAAHPDRHKRLGAAVAINGFYRIFREETALVGRYVLQMLYSLLQSLRLAHKDHISSGTGEAIAQAVDHAMHIIQVTVTRNNDQASLLRRTLERQFPHSIDDLLQFCWENCSAPETRFRRMCMECFVNLCALVERNVAIAAPDSKFSYAATWISRRIQSEGQDAVVTVIEQSIKNGMLRFPEGVTGQIIWLETFSGACDAYRWMLECGLSTPTALFGALLTAAPFSSKRKSRSVDKVSPQIFGWTETLVTTLMNSRHDTLKHETQNLRLQEARAEAVRRALAFLELFLRLATDSQVTQLIVQNNLWSSSMHELILLSILEPSSTFLFPSTSHSKEMEVFVPLTVERLLKNHCNLDQLKLDDSPTLPQSLASYIVSYPAVDLRRLSYLNVQFSADLVRGYSVLNHTQVLPRALPLLEDRGCETPQQLAEVVMSQVLDIPVNATQQQVQTGKNLFELALSLGLRIVSSQTECHQLNLLDALSEGSRASSTELAYDKGALLYARYAGNVHSAILGAGGRGWIDHGSVVIQTGKENPSILRVLRGLLDAVIRNRTLSQDTYSNIVVVFEKNERFFEDWSNNDQTLKPCLDLMVTLLGLNCRLPSNSQSDSLRNTAHRIACNVIKDSRSRVNVIIAALKLIPYILQGTTVDAPILEIPAANQSTFEENIADALEEMVVNHIPLSSKLADLSSIKGKSYLMLLKAYLNTFSSSGCLGMLEPMFPILKEGAEHMQWNWIKAGFENFVSLVAMPESCQPLLSVCKYCVQIMLDVGMELEVKRTLVDLVCLPLLKRCPESNIVNLFTSSDIQLKRLTSQPLVTQLVQTISDSVDTTKTPQEITTAAVTQSFSFALLETMYNNVSLDVLKGFITQVYVGTEKKCVGNELTKGICTAAHKACTLQISVPSQVAFRFNSAAFKCLALVVAKTQTDEKWFNRFLFQESNSFWAAVIDTSVDYHFKVETPSFRITFVGGNIESQPQRHSGRNGVFSQYMGSAFLSQSSLSQGVPSLFIEEETGQTADSDSFERNMEPPEYDTVHDSKGEAESKENSNSSVVPGMDDSVIAIELSDVNAQPCMASFMRAIERMTAAFGDTWIEDSPPGWLRVLSQKLSDSLLHLNIRLFLLQLLMNEPVSTIVKPWIGYLFEGVISCGISLFTKGAGLHYMLRDLCSTVLLTWGATPINVRLTLLASDFVSQLLKVVYDSSQPIRKDNIRVVRELLMLWATPLATQACLEISPVIDLLKTPLEKTGGAHAAATSPGSQARDKRMTALKLIAGLVSSEYPLFNTRNIHARVIYDGIKNCLSHRTHKNVRVCAAITYGLCSSMMRNEPQLHSDVSEFQQEFATLISSLETDTSKHEAMIDIVAAVVQHDKQSITRNVLVRCRNCFTYFKASQKADFMATLCEVEEQVILEAETIKGLETHFMSMLGDISHQRVGGVQVPTLQLYTLRFLRRFCEHLPLKLVERICGSSKSETTTKRSSLSDLLQTMPTIVRDEAYQLLIDLYSKHPLLLNCQQSDSEVTQDSSRTSSSSTSPFNIRKRIKILMLQGLADVDDEGMISAEQKSQQVPQSSLRRGETPKVGKTKHNAESNGQSTRVGIRRKLYDFFNSEHILSDNLVERLQSLMVDLFHPICANQWLHYSSYLLLALACPTRDTARPMFDRSLGDCTFRDLNIATSANSSFRVTHMTPMFSWEASTQSVFGSQQYGSAASQSLPFLSQTDDVSQMQDGVLRATQQMIWSQTQGHGVDMGWNSASSFGGTQWASQSQKLFHIGSSPNISKTDSSMPPPKTLPKKFVFSRHSQRFIRSSTEPNSEDAKGSGYKRKHVNLVEVHSRASTKEHAENQSKRFKKVVLYRTYRDGELPDIQIPLYDLCAPIQAMALMDAAIARQVFVGLFEQVYGHLAETGRSSSHKNKQAQESQKRLKLGIIFMLETCKYHTELIAALLAACRVCMQHDINGIEAKSALLIEDTILMLSPKTVSSAAVQSLNYHAGIWLLEDQIMHLRDHPECETVAQEAWLQLAKLYDCLNENDMLLGVCNKVSKVEGTRKALDAEVRGDYRTAIETYNRLMESLEENTELASLQEQESWKIRSLEDLKVLQDWDQLHTICSNNLSQVVMGSGSQKLETPADMDSIWSIEYRDYLKFHVMALVYNPDLSSYMDGFIDDLCSTEGEAMVPVDVLDRADGNSGAALSIDVSSISRRLWMETHMPLELAVAYLKRYEFGRVGTCINSARSKFLERWSALSKCAFSARRKQLQSLQRIVETMDCLNIISQVHAASSLEAVTEQIQQDACFPEDDTSAWGHVLLLRKLLLAHIESHPAGPGSHLVQCIKDQIDKLHLHAAAAAVRLGILEVAKDHLNALPSNTSAIMREEKIKGILSYNKRFIDQQLLTGNVASAASVFQKSLGLLDPQKSQVIDDPYLQLQRLLLRGQWHAQYAQFLPPCEEKSYHYSAAFGTFESASETEICLQALQLRSGLTDADEARTAVSAKCFETFASFCDDLLQECESATADSHTHTVLCAGNARGQLARRVVENYLKGMALGSKPSREKLPRLLQITGNWMRECTPVFRQTLEEHEIPTWFYLKWTSQLMSLLDRPEGQIAAQILDKVGTSYPRALFFPFKITSESLGAEGQARTRQLKQKLHDPDLEAFVEALTCLHNPELRWSDGLKKVAELLAAKKVPLAKELYLKTRSETLETSREYIGDKIGMCNRKFAEKYCNQIDQLIGPEAQKLTLKTVKAARDLVKSAQTTDEVQLSSFSEWLTEYDPSRRRIEVPGQYSDARPPNVHDHAYICSFSKSLRVMPSLRKPKRLSINASDEREYLFLVKGGEDLRSDERIEQMFELMNGIFERNAACSALNLRTTTYKVIPMTTRIGMLEWVNNTKPLKALINSEFESENPWAKAQESHEAFIKGDYHQNYQQASVEEACRAYERTCGFVPRQALRSALVKISPTPEGFITMRTVLARSLAVSSACSYVLGIGDRHLDNFLMDEMTGRICPIDFGVTFGIGTTLLPVPELIPFRLTPNLTFVLQPLDCAGLIRHYLILTLTALRDERPLICNALEVYLNEPVLDWISGAVDKNQILTLSQSDDRSWEPRRRVEQAVSKLKGVNPAFIMIEDIRNNKHVQKMGSLAALERIIVGTGTRAHYMYPEALDVSTQVDFLMEMATDPNILMRQWVGLATWV